MRMVLQEIVVDDRFSTLSCVPSTFLQTPECLDLV